MAAHGRTVTGVTLSTFLLCILYALGLWDLPMALAKFLPIALFVITWATFVFNGSTFYGKRIGLTTVMLWSLSVFSGSLYAISFFWHFDLATLMTNYLYLAISIFAVSFAVSFSRIISARILGYLSMFPLFSFGGFQIVTFALGFLENFVSFADALTVLCALFAFLAFLLWYFRKSKLTPLLFWFISSIGIIEIASATATLSFGLSYFTFPMIGLTFFLLACEWEQLIRPRGVSLVILVPFLMAGIFYVVSGLPIPQKVGLFSAISLALGLFFYTGTRSSMLLALVFCSFFGIVGYTLFVSYLSYYVSWWLAFPLLLPFLALLLYKFFQSPSLPILPQLGLRRRLPRPPQPPSKRYEIRSKPLFEGGMASVFLAKDKKNNKICVAKTHRIGGPNPDDYCREKLEDEIRILKLVSHPNIVKYIDSFKEGGRLFLVEDYIDGETLTDRFLGRPVGDSKIIEWSIQILDALKYLHDKKIIHRDINPNNIMVCDGDRRAVIIDFGTAKKEVMRTIITSRIQSGDYSSPEQQKFGVVHVQSDIFSVGAVMHFLATGEHPKIYGTRLMPSLSGGSSNPRLVNIIEKATSFDAQSRFQNVEEMLSELKNI